MAIVTKSEYKGHPMLELRWHENDERPFRFGISKSKLILECLDDIKAFVDENTEETL